MKKEDFIITETVYLINTDKFRLGQKYLLSAKDDVLGEFKLIRKSTDCLTFDSTDDDQIIKNCITWGVNEIKKYDVEINSIDIDN